MANIIITQVPVTSGEIYCVNIRPNGAGLYQIEVTYVVKSLPGIQIGHHRVVSWIPETATQAIIRNFINNQCVTQANAQEGM